MISSQRSFWPTYTVKFLKLSKLLNSCIIFTIFQILLFMQSHSTSLPLSSPFWPLYWRCLGSRDRAVLPRGPRNLPSMWPQEDHSLRRGEDVRWVIMSRWSRVVPFSKSKFARECHCRWEINRGNFVTQLRGEEPGRAIISIIVVPLPGTLTPGYSLLRHGEVACYTWYKMAYTAYTRLATLQPNHLYRVGQWNTLQLDATPPDAAWWNNLMEILETLWNRDPLMIPFPPLIPISQGGPEGHRFIWDCLPTIITAPNLGNFFGSDGQRGHMVGHLHPRLNLCPSSRLD